jgi:hypothetical protein
VAAVVLGALPVPRPEDGFDRPPQLQPRIGWRLHTDDIEVHLAEAAIGVLRELGVAGRRPETQNRGVVQAEVEDGVHHARHRDWSTGPHADQERVLRVAETTSRRGLDKSHVASNLRLETVRPAFGQIGLAGVRRHDEAGGHRQPQLGRHDVDPRGLAADPVLQFVQWQAEVVVEVVDVGHGPGFPFMLGRRGGRSVPPGSHGPGIAIGDGVQPTGLGWAAVSFSQREPALRVWM